MTDASREEAALAGLRHEQAEPVADDHVTADEAVPAPEDGVVRATPPPFSALLAAAGVGLVTLLALVLWGLKIAGSG